MLGLGSEVLHLFCYCSSSPSLSPATVQAHWAHGDLSWGCPASSSTCAAAGRGGVGEGGQGEGEAEAAQMQLPVS